VITAFVDGLTTKNVKEICSVIPDQVSCLKDLRKLTPAQLSRIGTVRNFKLGYVVEQASAGNAEALVGNTGTNCVPGKKPECLTNNDPAAVFDGNTKPFAALWKAQIAANNSMKGTGNTYSLNPCVEINGKWYADLALS
jgi:hypothetical protein